MIRYLLSIIFIWIALNGSAQLRSGKVMDSGRESSANINQQKDSTSDNKEIPKGIKVWTIDERFGDITPAIPDTLSYMYNNSIFTSGMRGEYNYLGNLGAPRISRLFLNRYRNDEQFIFTQPYDYFIVPIEQFRFTNTLSPITNLTYNTAGNKSNGEDHLLAKFAVNAGKRIGVGFIADYLYGRGFYANQASSHVNFTLYGSYLGERYQAHLRFTTNHQKIAENGGITDDKFITNPESFDDNYQSNEIPTVLEENWNRNNHQHIFLTHRYSFGFHRKVHMTPEEMKAKKFAMQSKQQQDEHKKNGENGNKKKNKKGEKNNEVAAGRPDNAVIAGVEPKAEYTTGSPRIAVKGKQVADSILAKAKKEKTETEWMKTEYVPVTSFIHTLKFDSYERIYQAYKIPKQYYAHTYPISRTYAGDSIYDATKYFRLRNSFAISLLEGFNKWAKAGLKAYATHEFRHFTLPDSVSGNNVFNENSVLVGGQLSKTQGKTLHYTVTGELGVVGKDMGKIDINAHADLNFKWLGDTLQLAVQGFFRRYNPTFYYRHYHSKHAWWDDDELGATTHTRMEGLLSYARTNTALRIAVDELTNYTYFAQTYDITNNYKRIGTQVAVRRSKTPINVLTLSLAQNVAWGALHWATVATFQNSAIQRALPLPKFNVYSNLFLRFKIAKVLHCDMGADVRYFTKYEASDYSPALGQFVVQENKQPIELGNYPIVNVYANFLLRQTRFFIMYTHINEGKGTRNSFLVPHYPINEKMLRFGLSWNFFN